MSLTLQETFREMDRFVKLSDGVVVRTAGEWLLIIDATDPAEYVLTSDFAGRLIIHRLDMQGCAITPPAFIERKHGSDRSPSDGFHVRPLIGITPQSYV